MGLVYVDDSLPGITRRPFRGKWRYFAVDGSQIRDAEEIARLNAIGLPPAYSDAWFAPSADAHILATGWDAKGRKQYRYHPDFRAMQESRKFDSCAAFGRLLPLIRARIDSDITSSGLGLDRAIASVVRLLDTGGIRVGNEAYVKANKSYGATTLRMRHAEVKGERLHLSFKAKSGKHRVMRVSDRGLAKFVKQMQDLPGQHLFQYIDEDGSSRPVTSTDVNSYIRESMGEDFTAKSFRTWVASARAFQFVFENREQTELKAMLADVSDHLGNTPAIARKSYIHPQLTEAAATKAPVISAKLPRRTRWLSAYERGLIDFLEELNPSHVALAA